MLVVVLALAVLLLARSPRPLPYVLAGMAPWAAAFTAAGFWWYDGYSTLVVRSYQGAAAHRPYAYFVWANPAANVPVVGLATVAALPDALRAVLRRTPAVPPGAPRGAGATGADAAPPAGGTAGAPPRFRRHGTLRHGRLAHRSGAGAGGIGNAAPAAP